LVKQYGKRNIEELLTFYTTHNIMYWHSSLDLTPARPSAITWSPPLTDPL